MVPVEVGLSSGFRGASATAAPAYARVPRWKSSIDLLDQRGLLYSPPLVAFTLRVTYGEDEPEQLTFEGGEVTLGRTADNDVVIKDPSSSRSHARVYEEEGRCFIEDLKSANGTTLNDRLLKAPSPLKAGDRIAIGDVVLEFSAPAAPSATLDGEDENEDPNATLLKPPTKPVVSAVAKPPAPPRRSTADLSKAQHAEPTAARGTPAVRPPSRVLPAAPPVAIAAAEPELSAADRARERRELQRSSMGRLQVLWSEFPRPTRIAVGLISALLTVAMLGTLVRAVMPKRIVKKNEPEQLTPNGEPLSDSFGDGDGVDFSRPDMKSFTFTFASPTAIVGVLNYQARECGKDEVSIELNGVQIGTVPPDTLDADQRQLDVVLPSAQLRVNEPNEVVFDNVRHPPAEDTWRIWNIWLEVIPVPKLSAEEASVRARDNFQRAGQLYELREVGSMNLFRAWKEYRDAWLLLEATPDRPDELLRAARARMRELRPQLDKKCASLLVTYQHEMNQKHPDLAAARATLQEINSFFEKEHPCFNVGRGLTGQLEDLGQLD